LGRRAKINAKPTTSVSVEVDVAEELDKLTTRGKTKNDIIKMLIDDHKDLNYLQNLIKERSNLTFFVNNIDQIFEVFKENGIIYGGLQSDELKNLLIEEKGFSSEQADFAFWFLFVSNRLTPRGNYFELKKW
jgi:hypothetical protein